ncbi:MAG: inverse autotransporter beta domain-containing protein, partial [Desulfovibrio sp.]|nr:inverse autotransporter beta domain-containing protein [Desulfovibrio sp.]
MRAHAAFFSRGGCAACFLILALCLPGPAAFAPAPASAAGHKPVPRLLSSPELAADIEKTLEAEKRGARGTRFPAGDVRRASAAGHKPVPRLQSSPELAADIEKTLEEEKRGARGIRFPAGGVRRGSAPSAASPRPLSPLLLEQAASFLGVPVPVRPGMDEGLGFHQDGTVRKAGGSASSGPSENGQRAGAYMRSGLDGYGLGNGLYGAGYGPGYDPLTGRHDPTRGGRRTSDQTRDFSDFDPLRMAQDRALSWSMGFLNSSAESLLSGITDNGRARLNFTIDWDGHFQGEGDVLLPFYDSRHTTIFMQIGARS